MSMADTKTLLSILVIDDDPVHCNLLRTILKNKFIVFAVESPSVGFKIIKSEKIDILICDFRLPEMDGLMVLEKVKEEHPEISVIMISSAGDMDTVIDALRKGAADFLRKPFTSDEIWFAVERTRRLIELKKDLNHLKKRDSHLTNVINNESNEINFGRSAHSQTIKHQIQMVAGTPDTTVLIIGESGTGKELVARGIHNLSKRKDELFCAVNMSAVPESLFESEFFGHKKGSFTGAITERAGWFETANGGTLFFDEIGEMSMALQVKLLRVLEDRRFTRVGTQNEQGFDVRIVAATNKPLEEVSGGKSLRLDLFHRLSTFIIELQPLRERTEDIHDLVNFFISAFQKKLGKQISGVHPDVYDLLKGYQFPGNIRELKNIIERAIIICDKDTIQPCHFMLPVSSNRAVASLQPACETFDLAKLERETIIRALQKVNYNKAEAARLLNIEWNALYRRILKYNIQLK